MAGRPRESSIQRGVLLALRRAGCWAVNVHGGPMQAVGTPDVIACVRGYFVSFECKRPGEGASDVQAYTIAQIAAAGGCAVVVDNADVIERGVAAFPAVCPLHFEPTGLGGCPRC